MTEKDCSIEGCSRKVRARNLCSMHYERRRKGIPDDARIRESHGKSKSPEYNIWNLMLSRCENKNNKSYPYYGGRGIKVCNGWRLSFSKFISDMGPRPKNYTIERIDNEKGYSKGNCVWASRLTQANNQRVKEGNNSGVSGVAWINKQSKWRARMSFKGAYYHLGLFNSLFEACCARKSKELALRKELNL